VSAPTLSLGLLHWLRESAIKSQAAESRSAAILASLAASLANESKKGYNFFMSDGSMGRSQALAVIHVV